MLQRSIIRPRTGTAIAERIPPKDSANEVVLRCQPVSAMIGLRNTPKVKARTGPLQTNRPVTAPTTTHQGLVNLSPKTLSFHLARSVPSGRVVWRLSGEPVNMIQS